jgi:hypothetical protein
VLKVAKAVALGIATFLAIYNCGAMLASWSLADRIIHRGERDYLAEALMLFLVAIASSAAGIVASYFDRTQPMLVAVLVGALAAAVFCVIYIAHHALVPFLAVLVVVNVAASAAGGFGLTRFRQRGARN